MSGDVVETWATLNRWRNYTGTRAGELPTYVRSGCHSIRGGVLSITARRDTAGGWRSALLYSAVLVPPAGLLTARVRSAWLPGHWPAVWLLGASGDWPGCGEVDLLEVPGRKANADGSPLLHGNIHGVRGDGSHWQWPARTSFRPGEWVSVGVDFRRPGEIRWLVDGSPLQVWRRDQAPADVVWPAPAGGYRMVVDHAVGGWGGAPDPDGPDVVTTEFGEIRWTQ